MRKIKKYWLLTLNKFLSFVLLLLGFGSSDEERKDMYGMPPARFSVKANVLNEDNVQTDLTKAENLRYEFTINLTERR